MTTDAFVEDHEQCLAAGMNDPVSKPVIPHALYAALLRRLPRAPGRGGNMSAGSGQPAR